MNKNYKKTSKFSLDEKIENSKFNFCKNLKWFLIAPIVICLVGVVLLCTLGFNLGIDFTGGSNMTIYLDTDGTYTVDDSVVSTDQRVLEQKINNVLREYGLDINTYQDTTMNISGMGIEDGKAVIIKYQNNNKLETAKIEEINDKIRLDLLKAFKYVNEDATLETIGSIEESALIANGGITTASASSELMMKSFIALLVAILLILVYVAFRFEFTSGLAAILALFHDLLVTTSIMLICRIEINVSFIAALVTILGYSVNNTIIIFDRMRSDLKTAKQSNAKISNQEVANGAVRASFMRTILTTLTTFIMIFMVTVIGVPDIREFAFPIMIGILAGFYSATCLTPGLWAIAYRPKKNKKSNNSQPKKSNDDNVEIVVE